MWFILSSCSCDLCVCVNAQVVGLSNEKYNFVENEKNYKKIVIKIFKILKI